MENKMETNIVYWGISGYSWVITPVTESQIDTIQGKQSRVRVILP